MNERFSDIEGEDFNLKDKINDVIDGALNKRASESQKKEILNSIYSILYEQTNELVDIFANKQNSDVNHFVPNYQNKFQNAKPSINIFLFNPTDNFQYPNTYYNQQQLIQANTPNQPLYTNSPYITNYPSQIYMNPNLINQPAYSYITSTEKTDKAKSIHKKKESKKDSKQKSHKSHEKSKKSKKKHSKEHKEAPSDIQTFNCQNPNRLDGIIRYLTQKAGGNIHNNGTIEVTTNSLSSSYHPKNMVDLNSSNYYEAQLKEKYAWVCFDFKNMQVEITRYSIKSTNCSPGLGHIKNWVLEVSKDKNEWKIIDERSNYSELNGPNIIKSFDTKRNHFSRYCRLRHTGDYWGIEEGMYFQICAIEFYGRLKTPK